MSSKIPDQALAFRARVFRRFAPPVSLKLAEWAEANIVLPSGQSARPGAYRNWPYFTEILNAIGASAGLGEVCPADAQRSGDPRPETQTAGGENDSRC